MLKIIFFSFLDVLNFIMLSGNIDDIEPQYTFLIFL